MTLGHGIPSHDAFSDLFNALDPRMLQTVMVRLAEGFAGQWGDVIAVDGKSLRRSGLKAIGKITATREASGKTSRQTRYFLFSTPLSAERFLAVTRAHWAIENSLHWVLDVTMNEDAARNRTEIGPENFAILRRISLNLARA